MQQAISELPFASVPNRVFAQNYSCESAFRLQVHFYVNQTLFHVKGLREGSFWNRGTSLSENGLFHGTTKSELVYTNDGVRFVIKIAEQYSLVNIKSMESEAALRLVKTRLSESLAEAEE